jgi:hypothetical protein
LGTCEIELEDDLMKGSLYAIGGTGAVLVEGPTALNGAIPASD